MLWIGVEWEHGGRGVSAATAQRANAEWAEWAAWTADTQRQIEEWLAARAVRAEQAAPIVGEAVVL